jgi:hypothetical protein
MPRDLLMERRTGLAFFLLGSCKNISLCRALIIPSINFMLPDGDNNQPIIFIPVRNKKINIINANIRKANLATRLFDSKNS